MPPPDVSLAQNATTMLFSNGMILLGPPTGGGCMPIQTACLEPQRLLGSRSLVLFFLKSMATS